MKYLFLLLSLFTFVSFSANAAPADSPQNKQWVAKAETYLQNLKMAKADFDLIAPDESMRSGTFYLKRPGRLRFEYSGIHKDLIVADGTLIHFHDSATNQSQSAPVQSTLANFFLRSKMSLSGDLKVAKVEDDKEYVHITMVQKDSPDTGNITLSFDKSPFVLKGWRVSEYNGNVTRMRLKNLQENPKLANDLFTFKDPSGRGRVNK